MKPPPDSLTIPYRISTRGISGDRLTIFRKLFSRFFVPFADSVQARMLSIVHDYGQSRMMFYNLFVGCLFHLHMSNRGSCLVVWSACNYRLPIEGFCMGERTAASAAFRLRDGIAGPPRPRHSVGLCPAGMHGIRRAGTRRLAGS